MILWWKFNFRNTGLWLRYIYIFWLLHPLDHWKIYFPKVWKYPIINKSKTNSPPYNFYTTLTWISKMKILIFSEKLVGKITCLVIKRSTMWLLFSKSDLRRRKVKANITNFFLEFELFASFSYNLGPCDNQR